MFKHFLRLEWKGFFRSASFGKSLGMRIFMLFLSVYMTVALLSLGAGLYPILNKLVPEQNPVEVINGFFLLWLLFELVYRFFLQTLPVVKIKPLMIMPIKRNTVVHYVLLKSLFSFYNLIVLCIAGPFAAIVAYKTEYTWSQMLVWLLAVFLLSLVINYANFIIKKRFTDNLKGLIPFLAGALLLGLLEYFDLFSIRELLGTALNYVITLPYLVVVPLLMVLMLYAWNLRNLREKFYLDAGLKSKAKQVSGSDFAWTRRFGDMAAFLQLDLKLIWRNKRPRTTVILSILILAYGLIFYTNDIYAERMPFFFVFVGIFMTGIFMVNFGQFVPSWDSSYYSMMMAQNIPLRKYLESKAFLMSFSVVVLGILTTPYVYFGYDILMMNLVCALYNLGVNVPMIIYAGSFNKKRIDLEKSPFMNTQGTGAAQFLIILPLMVFPLLVFIPFQMLISFNAGLIALALCGIVGLLLRRPFMQKITEAYAKRKYAMISGFKEEGE
ncbi:DUF5687 family protein [Croceiramulus getboli]|nr:DUF5687 family protein [Flavobacteriaceae bacterium YJPT1-3]